MMIWTSPFMFMIPPPMRDLPVATSALRPFVVRSRTPLPLRLPSHLPKRYFLPFQYASIQVVA